MSKSSLVSKRLSGSLTIGIDARVTPGISGGVAYAISGLVHALGQLTDGSETYAVVVGSRPGWEFMRPFVGPNQRLLLMPRPSMPRLWLKVRQQVGHALGPITRRLRRPRLGVASLTHFYEGLGCDVVHFPHQEFLSTALPTVFNPHDLQHLHYPQFFTASAVEYREVTYRAGCHVAHTVVAASKWIRDDLIRQYGVRPGKVQVIPWGPPTQSYPEPSQDAILATRQKYSLDQPFAFYPAVTWPHKNHVRLLEAIARLRDQHDLRIQLVCTGSIYEPCWPSIVKCIEQLDLRWQVRFLGFVPDRDMRAIYRLAQFVVVPTLFESDSFPIFEAWLEGTPVTCSNVTSLPDQVSDAAVLFDPERVEAIADAVAKLATNVELRRHLRECGYRRLRDFDWKRTARAYRAVYRRAAGQSLSEDDQSLLAWDWMREPRGKLAACT